jgi:hypothetical protein
MTTNKEEGSAMTTIYSTLHEISEGAFFPEKSWGS